MKKLTILIIILLLIVLPGCLKRREVVAIDHQGRLQIKHAIQGDKGDLDGGPDAMPSGKPWTTHRERRLKDDGSEEFRLVAEASFSSAAELPTSFATAEAELGSLVFETELRVIKSEPKRRVYLFRRIYRARPWAEYDHLFRSRVPDDLKEKLTEPGDIGHLEGRDQERALQVLVDYEIAKMVLWTRKGITGLGIEDELAARLAIDRVREALEAWRRENLAPEKVGGLLSLGDQALAATCEKLVRATKEIIGRESAAALGADPAWNATAFENHRAAAEREHDVSQDLQDEDFELVLKVPGRVLVAAGGTTTDDGVHFRFKGRDLLDRDQVIELLYEMPPE